MLAGISYDEAVGLVGHINSTRTRELVTVLSRLGWKCKGRLTPLGKMPVSMLKHALVKLKYNKGSTSHWLAVHNGKVFDPAYQDTQKWGRITSYLELEKDG